MNANSQPATLAIKVWLNDATQRLSDAGIPSASLDAELILAHSLQVNRTFLHAHFDDTLDQNVVQTANKYMESRLKRLPIAYIVGYKEFYGRDFIVTPDTLVPRPESEDMITILKSIIQNPKSTLQLLDVGTGSGCLGITAKLEFPKLNVTLLDISNAALDIAEQNATELSADVQIQKSDLLQSYDGKPDMVIANLPYVNPEWDTSPETDHEPSNALFEEDNGMKLIKELILQSSEKLNKNGYLIIEADPVQHDDLTKFAIYHSFHKADQQNYVIAFSNSK